MFLRRTDEVVGHRALKTQLRSAVSHPVSPSGAGGCVGTYTQRCTFPPETRSEPWPGRAADTPAPSTHEGDAPPGKHSPVQRQRGTHRSACEIPAVSGTVPPEKPPTRLPWCLTCRNSLAANSDLLGCCFQQCLWLSAAESMSIYTCQAGLRFFYKYLNYCGHCPSCYVFSIFSNSTSIYTPERSMLWLRYK